MTNTNELREKIQDVLNACGNHSLSEDTIIHIKDTLGIFVSKKLAQARAEERARVRGEIEGRRKPLLHDVNWAQGYNQALDTLLSSLDKLEVKK